MELELTRSEIEYSLNGFAVCIALMKVNPQWFNIKKNLKVLQKEAEVTDQRKRDLIDIYAKKDDKGEVVKIEKDGKDEVIFLDEKAFKNDINELMSEKVTLNLHRIVIDDTIEWPHDQHANLLLFNLGDKLIFHVDDLPENESSKESSDPSMTVIRD